MERTISKHIKDRYKLVGCKPGEMIIRGRTYDFRNITKEDADQLFAGGCRFLVPASKEAEKQILEELKLQDSQKATVGQKQKAKGIIDADALIALSKKTTGNKPQTKSKTSKSQKS